MRSPLLVFVFTSAALCQTPSDNPQLASSKAFYDQVKGIVLKSVDKMPEDKYSYRPTDEVRTYGQLLAHIADGQFFLCSIAKEGKPAPRGIEKSAKTKAEILKGLNDGFAYCDALYAELTDASSAAMVSWFGQQRTKLSMLAFNTAHTMEHYGNLVTYMRINKIVPPSSENPAPAKPKPPQ
jgi:uncharacterized damage-inducible protein DinB